MARVSIDDAFISDLQSLMGSGNAAKLTEDALTLLNWAATEVKNGRTIFSANDAVGEQADIHKLAMPSLTKIKPSKA